MQLLTEPALAGHFRGLGFPLHELYIQFVWVCLVPPFRGTRKCEEKNRPVEPTEPSEKLPQGSPRHQWRRIHHQSHGWRIHGQHVGVSPIFFVCFFLRRRSKYTLEDWHGTYKSPILKGKWSSKPPRLCSMLIFRAVWTYSKWRFPISAILEIMILSRSIF